MLDSAEEAKGLTCPLGSVAQLLGHERRFHRRNASFSRPILGKTRSRLRSQRFHFKGSIPYQV